MNKSFACNEYDAMSRRQFLSGTGKLALALGAVGLLPKVAMAQGSNSSRDIILQVYLRGGCDGLSLCVPFGEDAYYTLRPTLAIPRPDALAVNPALNLDGFFGVSPALAPLMDAYAAGHLLFVHGVGHAYNTRSHFDSQLWTETGYAANTAGSGWLGRHLNTTTPMLSTAPVRALSIGDAVTTTLTGASNVPAVPDPATYKILGSDYLSKNRQSFVQSAYSADGDELVRRSALTTLATVDMLKTIDFVNYVPAGGAAYPVSDIGHGLASAAALIRSDVGVEAMTLDVPGWDTHAMAGANGGHLQELMADLASSLAAFHADMEGSNRLARVTVVVMSEFGRAAKENASKGTDHGTGGAMMVLGGAVKGGRVLANWPGLTDLLDNADLRATIDYRDILAEIVSKRLGNGANLGTVFPQYSPTFRGVF